MSSITGPKQVVLITMRDNEKENIITLAWHTPLSFSPQMYAIAIGKKRYSAKLLDNSGVFAVNFIPESMKETALKCGTTTGEFTNKFREFNIQKAEAERIDCPIIKDCIAYLECRIKQKIETGDHHLYIAEIVNSKTNRDDYRLFHPGGMSSGEAEFTTTVKS